MGNLRSIANATSAMEKTNAVPPSFPSQYGPNYHYPFSR